MIKEDTILVGFNAENGDAPPILIIGRKFPNQSMSIVNAFQGDEAVELYTRLVTKKEKTDEA